MKSFFMPLVTLFLAIDPLGPIPLYPLSAGVLRYPILLSLTLTRGANKLLLRSSEEASMEYKGESLLRRELGILATRDGGEHSGLGAISDLVGGVFSSDD